MMDDKEKRLAFSIVDYLDKVASTPGKVSEDDAESLQVAIQCISDVFGIQTTDESQRALYSTAPATLPFIVDMFLKTQEKIKNQSKPAPPADAKKLAEEAKAVGNKKMTEKDYVGAIAMYDRAIALDDKNAVYFSNRAAAYSQSGNHDKAVEDALHASKLDPTFSKAYSRLGHAYFSLSKYTEAAKAYERGLELDPQNATMKNALETVKSKLSNVTSASRGVPAAGGLGDMGGGGGMPDLGSMMNNPMFMSMAQQMMSNPRMMQMAQNMMRNSGGEGGEGGMPNMQDILNNPEMMEMARNMMGGGGGARQ